jgi:hypothetical protein
MKRTALVLALLIPAMAVLGRAQLTYPALSTVNIFTNTNTFQSSVFLPTLSNGCMNIVTGQVESSGIACGTITGATTNGGLVVTGSTLGLLTSCSNNQVLQWNSTAWICASVGTGTIPLTCQDGLNNLGTSIPAGTTVDTFCFNTSGKTWNLTGISCYTNTNGSSTLSVTDNASNSLLTGPIACANNLGVGTQSATTTILSPSGCLAAHTCGFINFSFVSDGTPNRTTWVVSMTQ